MAQDSKGKELLEEGAWYFTLLCTWRNLQYPKLSGSDKPRNQAEGSGQKLKN